MTHTHIDNTLPNYVFTIKWHITSVGGGHGRSRKPLVIYCVLEGTVGPGSHWLYIVCGGHGRSRKPLVIYCGWRARQVQEAIGYILWVEGTVGPGSHWLYIVGGGHGRSSVGGGHGRSRKPLAIYCVLCYMSPKSPLINYFVFY